MSRAARAARRGARRPGRPVARRRAERGATALLKTRPGTPRGAPGQPARTRAPVCQTL
jgi:hypothetical protein